MSLNPSFFYFTVIRILSNYLYTHIIGKIPIYVYTLFSLSYHVFHILLEEAVHEILEGLSCLYIS